MSETVAARWEEYNEGGRRSFGLGQFAEAEELFRAAVREGEQLGADSPHLATSLNALGQLRLQAKDFAEAETCFTRALAIRQKTYGADSHAIAPSLNNLSALHDAKGETEQAVELLRRSLTITEQALGASHPDVAVALTTLAKLHFKRRDFAKADRLLLRLLETKRALGKDHPEVATVLGSLAKLRQAVNKHGPAEQLWRQSLAIRERAFAPNDPILATTLENVADCCAAQDGKLLEAIALRERALVIREAAVGAGHPSVATARAKLGELRARPGGAAAPAAPNVAPPRSSQEVPSPLLSHEVPPYAAGQSAPTPNLPWIQLDAEPTGERPSPHLELMGMEPPMPVPPRANALDRKAASSRTPLVPPPIPAMARASRDLVLTDSLAPDATPVRPRDPQHVPRAAPAPSRAAYLARDGRAAHRPPLRMPRTMAESDGSSKKALLAAVILVALAGAGGWLLIAGKVVLPVPLSAAPAAVAGRLRSVTVFSRSSTPLGKPTPIVAAAAATRPLANPPLTNPRAHAAPVESRAPAAPPRASGGTAQPAAAARTATNSADAPIDLSPPTIGSNSEIDAVTRGIEQSIGSKLDSAQKSRLEPKAPIFKKP